MSKITLSNLVNLQNENTAVATINSNSSTIQTAFDNTLSRDGTSPNQMGSNLDMNNFHILNLPEPSSDTDPVRLIDMNVTNANLIHTASSTSNTIGTGTKTFTVPSSLGFQPGQYVLIQQSGNTANYMTGRVTSYSSTSLVTNITQTGGSGTFSNWTIDISGAPGATGPASTLYDTKATVAAATVPGTQTFVGVAGNTTVGDGGSTQYMRQVSVTTEPGSFQSADGAYWRVINNVVTPEAFGCKGDGTTDDRANFQSCIDFVTGRGGGWIYCTPGKTYKIVITALTTDLGLIFKPKVGLRMNGASINYDCSAVGQCYGGRAMSYTRFIGPGTMATTATTAPGGAGQSIWQAPLSIGSAAGANGTVLSPSAYEGVNDVLIEGITFTSVRNDNKGTMIQGYGGCTNITIRNCIFPDNANMLVAIGFDWNNLGTMSSADINGCKTSYLAGTAYTTHPSNLVIEGNQIGNFTNAAGTTGIRVSGCYDCLIRFNDIQSVTSMGIFHTGGDLGFEFAPTSMRLNACKDIVIEGNNVYNYKGGIGLNYEAYPDNVYDAVTNPANPSYPYTSIFYTDGYHTNTQIRGNKFATSSVTNNLSGILIGFTRGVRVSDNIVDGEFQGQYGIRVQKLSRNVLIEHNMIQLTTNAGIYVNDPNIENCHIRNNWVTRCSGSNSAQGNIYVNTSTNCVVEGNYLGATDEDQATNGIKIDTGATYASVLNNLIWEVKTGGFAINIVNPSNISTIWECRDNRYVGSNGSAYTGLGIVPYRRDYSIGNPNKIITHAHAQRALMTSDLTPTFGAWEVGSTVTNVDAAVGQKKIVTCTVAGSPGTWGTVATVS